MLGLLDRLRYDVRSALHGLRRHWGYTSAAIAMLALAIGLNVTVFTVMQTMLFRGFPLVQRNDRLLYVQEEYPSGLCCLSYADFEDWRSEARAFQGMAFVGGKAITLGDRQGRPMDTSAATVTANIFGLLRVSPMLGRDFVPSDESPGAPAVAILSYRFWESRFAKRRDIVGLTIRIDQKPAVVIAVMPQGFDFPEQKNLWMPLAHTPELLQRGPGGYMAVGRLRDGVSVEEARAELQGINRRLEAAFPATNRGVVARVDTHAQFFVGPDVVVVYGSLWAAAWFVLLIGCANLANLTLARTLGRWREFSTRIALGATQGRMMRQILLENLALAGIAAALGGCITVWGVRAWAVATASRYQIFEYKIDFGTLAYLVAIAIAAAFLSSLAPMMRVWRLGLSGVLTSAARGATQGPRGKRLAAALVACQMALAVVLLCGSGVLVRSVWNVVHARTGVRAPGNVLVGLIRLPSEKYPTAARQVAYFDNLEAKLRSMPGVESETIADSVPVGSGEMKTFEIEGRAAGRYEQAAQFISAGAGYFRTMGAPAIAGREFNVQDHASAPLVAMVNQSFADRFWPGEPSLGRRIRGKSGRQHGAWLTVVGVAPNIMQGDAIRQAGCRRPVDESDYVEREKGPGHVLPPRTGRVVAHGGASPDHKNRANEHVASPNPAARLP
ncbi:MAG TPA: ABC transporter permease [Bryobacteraceae bacterium]|nr:ABC transporter permease [Bryobacteraceae bacterium]